MARVLVIEDDVEMRSMMMCTLDRAGYETIGACDGREGLASFRRSPADLIITDIFMPEMDGVETIIELRRDFPDARIIAVSGGGRLSSDDYLPFAEKLGARLTLRKPFSPPELLSAVDQVLSESSGPNEQFTQNATRN